MVLIIRIFKLGRFSFGKWKKYINKTKILNRTRVLPNNLCFPHTSSSNVITFWWGRGNGVSSNTRNEYYQININYNNNFPGVPCVAFDSVSMEIRSTAIYSLNNAIIKSGPPLSSSPLSRQPEALPKGLPSCIFDYPFAITALPNSIFPLWVAD